MGGESAEDGSMHYVFLSLAVVAEVAALWGMKGDFTKIWPVLVAVAGFVLSFGFMAISLREIPVGIAYAFWSGLGIVLVTGIGWVVHKEALDWPAISGVGLIIAGCLTINLFSKAAIA